MADTAVPTTTSLISAAFVLKRRALNYWHRERERENVNFFCFFLSSTTASSYTALRGHFCPPPKNESKRKEEEDEIFERRPFFILIAAHYPPLFDTSSLLSYGLMAEVSDLKVGKKIQ